MKKFLSLFFCVMLLFTLLSTSVLAADTCTFTLVVEPAEGGTMSDDYGLITTSSKQYQKDSLVNFNAAANKGYHLAGWKKDGKFLGAPYSYAFTTDKDYTITAVFEKGSFQYQSDANGHWKQCSCGTKEGTTEKHTPKKANERPATETSAGYTGDTICTVCSHIIESGKEIPATGSTTSKNTTTVSSSNQGTTASKVQGTTSSKAQGTTSSVVNEPNTNTNTNTNTNANANTNTNSADQTSSTVVMGTNSNETIGAVTENKDNNKDKDNGNNTVLIAVIAVAAVILIAAGVAAIIVFTKKPEETVADATEEPKE